MSGIPTPPLGALRLKVLEPFTVYHYTSLQAMMKIVESRQLWATGIEYLNDTAERTLFLSRAKMRLPDYLKEHPEIPRDIFDTFLDETQSEAKDLTRLPSVVSFSSDPDSLTQWRAYCPPGTGVCIGFDVSCLKNARINHPEGQDKDPVYFRPSTEFKAVEYLDRLSDWKINEGIFEAYKLATNAFSINVPGGESTITLSEYFSSILEQSATFYKDASFRSEAEHRLVVGATYWDRSYHSYRCNRWSLVPYLKVDIPNQNGRLMSSPTDNAPWDAVTHVCIGPTADKDLTARAVGAFLRSHGMSTEIRTTDTPFRDW